ncbi:pilus assembly PilX N-terminal domain-containing protein [Patescibacteria group bacterium]|nr:pilus assembly PilX N-terminal domain-containing protein [Patescibacteria group bacterium]
MKTNKDNKIFFQKGAVAIILTVMTLNVLLIIGLGIGVLILQQVKLSIQSSESVVAFYAAEAGAERCLYEVRKNSAVSCPYTNIPLAFDSQAKYTTTYNASNMITSIGQYKGTSRKVELTW